jgi:hypothetical protein
VQQPFRALAVQAELMAEMTRSRRAMRSLGADFIHLPWGFLFQHNHCNNLFPVIHQKLAARDFRT